MLTLQNYVLRLLLPLTKEGSEWLLDIANKQTQHSKQLSKSKAPSTYTDSVDEEVDQEPVGEDKDKEDAKVPPLIAGRDVKRRQELVSVLVWAVLAVRCGRLLEKVSACLLGKVACVLLTGLS